MTGTRGREYRSPAKGIKDMNKDVAGVVWSRRLFWYPEENDSVEDETLMV